MRDCSLGLFLPQTEEPRYYSRGSHSHVDEVVEADCVAGVANLEDALDLIGLHQCLKNGIHGNFLLPGPIEDVRDGKDCAQIVFIDVNLPIQLEPRYRYNLKDDSILRRKKHHCGVFRFTAHSMINIHHTLTKFRYDPRRPSKTWQ